MLTFCAGLIAIGVKSLREYTSYGNLVAETYLIGLPVGIIFFVGSLLFVVALIGIVATVTESKCLIATYCTLLLTTFVLLVAAVGVLFACENTVVGGLEASLCTGLQSYFIDVNVTKEIDSLQQSQKCCGVHNYTDWENTPWYRNQSSHASFPFPPSCCQHSNCTKDHDASNVFGKSCYSAVSSSLLTQFIICSSISAAVAVLLVFAFAAICFLYARRQDYRFIGLVEDDAVRV